MIPSDATRIMLSEPAFVPQMGAARQRSKYASSPAWLASSVIGRCSTGGRCCGPSPHPMLGRLPGPDIGSLRCSDPSRGGDNAPAGQSRHRRSGGALGFFEGATSLTRTPSLFPSPTAKSGRRGRGTTARGYGSAHQKLRKRLAPKVAAGGVRCWRCGELILAGEQWDLGHDDVDRRAYRGPEHIKCNRATSNRRRWQSREW